MKNEQIRARLKKAGDKIGKCLKKVAWQTCKCVIWTACAPCLCCVLLCLPARRSNRRHTGRRKAHEQPQFPAPRPRALSLPLVAYQENQITLDQPQSQLMTKLPLEVRRMIYERALGGVTIHLQSEKGRPRAKQCPREECTCFYFDPISEKSLSFGLGLLRTCRLVYDEAIEFLYSANTFSLTTEGDELTTVNYLSHYFLPQRLSQIRDLRFHWFLDIAPFVFMLDWLSPSMEPWLRSWDSLSRMTGLRKLHVVLEYRLLSFDEGYKKMWKEKEVELLAAVKTVTAPRHFVVVLPNRRCTTDLDVGPSRCVFRSSEEQQSPDMP